MSRIRGNLDQAKQSWGSRDPLESVETGAEVKMALPLVQIGQQAATCLGCGAPSCSSGSGCNAQGKDVVGCSLDIDIQTVNQLVAQGRRREAFEVSRRKQLFGDLLSRVCPHTAEQTCEPSCVEEYSGDGAVAISSIEASLWDEAWETFDRARAFYNEAGCPDDFDWKGHGSWIEPFQLDQKLAPVVLVGSGWANMAVALRMAQRGHKVHMIERHDQAWELGDKKIKPYKIADARYQHYIDLLEMSGVEIHTERSVGMEEGATSIPALAKEFNAKAVVLATGTPAMRDHGLKGKDADQIEGSNVFLREGQAEGHLVIIGTGDTAVDVARDAIRKGGVTKITIISRHDGVNARDQGDLDAYQKMVVEAQAAGVELDVSLRTKPHSFEIRDGKRILHCTKTEPNPDQSGRFRDVPDSAFEIESDSVVSAVGNIQGDLEALTGLADLPVSPWGSLDVVPEHHNINDNHPTERGMPINSGLVGVIEDEALDDVFLMAAAQVISGDSIAVNAARAGRDTADMLIEILNGEHTVEDVFGDQLSESYRKNLQQRMDGLNAADPARKRVQNRLDMLQRYGSEIRSFRAV